MFGMFGSKPASRFKVMNHDVEVASVSRGGKVLFTGDTVNAWPKTHLEGQIFEVMLRSRSGLPYFAYYLCKDYYFAVASPAGAGGFGGPFRTEEFRTAVSQRIGLFVAEHLLKVMKVDARADIVGFRHNRVHTNVLAFVPTLGEWHAIQHCDAEDDDATDRKVSGVANGSVNIKDVVAIDAISPNGRD
ncbi:hypothetical protein [Sphingomonas corticis]|uniref:Uncharacterized protein n=1 Tax=Sphingomonas corticis TaxID=2722791 RepID=A0ABX1CRZ0_9SPHN|nr:hypothetical protein [Sphingomonas corticis]NJR79162.1 hypothetical protein [Sphingomonas corticis]